MEKGKSAFLVTGDSSRNKVLCVPGGGFATVKIVLPAAWDSLMAKRGYKPLASFRLQTALAPDALRERRTRAGRASGGRVPSRPSNRDRRVR